MTSNGLPDALRRDVANLDVLELTFRKFWQTAEDFPVSWHVAYRFH
jgi:hypothetical protein